MIDYQIVVIGAGHAGCEAAYASAKMGMKTALLTMRKDRIAEMSCNPAIGGLAKGHIVKEIDALGGIMGLITDRAGIQFRILNRSRGPAVQAPRAQCDKQKYSDEMTAFLKTVENLHIIEGEASSLISDKGRIKGIELSSGAEIICDKVILTAGTFLKGLIHIGPVKQNGGRVGELPSRQLSQSLLSNNLELGRLKTGTPSRVLKNSVDWQLLTEQKGEENPIPFSWRTDKITNPLVSCYITYTNDKVHKVIMDNMDKSPLYSGEIHGIGPRYCPSIEDKVVRFSEKKEHQIFLEPEGLATDWIYLNGISSSLPAEVQKEFISKIKGLENAEIVQYGYAIEYDYILPTQLKLSLETREISGFYSAGQVNGTSGYEEAAAQGLLAGINASLSIKGEEPLIIDRSKGYMGVLIDDLVTKGTKEPYRMFTSRAEYRLLLGTDSVDKRFTEIGYKLGLVDSIRLKEVNNKYDRIDRAVCFLKKERITPSAKNNESLKEHFNVNISRPLNLEELLRRPEVNIAMIRGYACKRELEELKEDEMKVLENTVKYEGYINKQLSDVERRKKQELVKIPEKFEYKGIPGLSAEIVEKLETIKPENLGQAGRISGVTPEALTLIAIYIKKRAAKDK